MQISENGLRGSLSKVAETGRYDPMLSLFRKIGLMGSSRFMELLRRYTPGDSCSIKDILENS
jgi:hypothetical protein